MWVVWPVIIILAMIGIIALAVPVKQMVSHHRMIFYTTLGGFAVATLIIGVACGVFYTPSEDTRVETLHALDTGDTGVKAFYDVDNHRGSPRVVYKHTRVQGSVGETTVPVGKVKVQTFPDGEGEPRVETKYKVLVHQAWVDADHRLCIQGVDSGCRVNAWVQDVRYVFHVPESSQHGDGGSVVSK